MTAPTKAEPIFINLQSINTMKTGITTLCIILLTFSGKAQNQSYLRGEESLGGYGHEIARSIQQTLDGGSIIAGYSNSVSGDVTGNHGGDDCWIVKLTHTGEIQWQKCLGGTNQEEASCARQTNDGGYIIAASCYSQDGDVIGNHGGWDYWVIKLTAAGNIKWQKCLGGTDNEFAQSIRQTTDGGYIVAGYSRSKDGDLTNHHGGERSNDYWVIKLDSTGSIQWQRSLGGRGNDYAYSVVQTVDGDYVVAGTSFSNKENVSGNHGNGDYWIVKLSARGRIQWQKCFGGSGGEDARCIEQTRDGGFIVAGTSTSNDGDVSGNHGGKADYWVVKSDASGKIQWQKSLGGSYEEYAYSIAQTEEGGYIVAGTSTSNDGDVSGHHGIVGTYLMDYWVAKLDSRGTIRWQHSLGGTFIEEAYSIQQIENGAYIVAGYSQSSDGDVTGHHGGDDYWVVKLSASGNLASPGTADDIKAKNISTNSLHITPNPVQQMLHIEGLDAKQHYEISIINLTGTLLQTASVKNASSYDINVSRLPSGTYYVKIGAVALKFVKL